MPSFSEDTIRQSLAISFAFLKTNYNDKIKSFSKSKWTRLMYCSQNSNIYIFFSGQSTDMKYYGLTKPKENKQGLKVIRLKRHSRLERWNSKTKGHHRGVGPARPRSYLDFTK